MRLVSNRLKNTESLAYLTEKIFRVLPTSYQYSIDIKEITTRLKYREHYPHTVVTGILSEVLNTLVKQDPRVRLAIKEKRRFFGKIYTYRTEFYRVIVQSVPPPSDFLPPAA